MSLYGYISLGSNESALITNIETQHEAMRGFERGTSTPTVIVVGQFWTRTDHPTYGEAIMRRSNAGTWAVFCDPEATQVNNLGTVAYAANQPMGGFKLTGLAAGSANGDSVRYEQVLRLVGGTMSGNIAMGTSKVTGLGAPTAVGDAARYEETIPDKRIFSVGTIANGGSVSVNLGFRPKRVVLKGWQLGFTHSGGVTNVRSAQTIEYQMHNGDGVGEGGEMIFRTDIGLVVVEMILTNSASGFDLQLTARLQNSLTTGGSSVPITAISGNMAANSYRAG